VGNFVPVNVPGATNGTYPMSINSSGTIVGTYIDGQHVSHGFIRSSNGVITKINIPDAGIKRGQGTSACCINDSGVISGYFITADGTSQGFLMTSEKIFTTFKIPDPTIDVYLSSAPSLGVYSNVSGTSAGTGFIRSASGTTTKISNGFVFGIDPAGTVVGTSVNEAGAYEAFTLSAAGQERSIQVEGAGTGSEQGTVALGINNQGTIMGWYSTAKTGGGFTLTSSGELFEFNCKGAAWDSTAAYSVNSSGTITGSYYDGASVSHGFTVVAGSKDCTKLDAPNAGTGGFYMPIGLTQVRLREMRYNRRRELGETAF